MMYAYYPGCSLTESAKDFDVSTRKVMSGLGAELREIDDWTCCGASAVDSVSKLLAYSLPARNLVLSQRQMPGADMLVPCSACYLNHLRVTREIGLNKGLAADLNEVLAVENMEYAFTGRVRHLLDVLVNRHRRGRHPGHDFPTNGGRGRGSVLRLPDSAALQWCSTIRNGRGPWNRSCGPWGRKAWTGKRPGSVAGLRSWPPSARRPWFR